MYATVLTPAGLPSRFAFELATRACAELMDGAPTPEAPKTRDAIAIMRPSEVCRTRGRSRSCHYKDVSEGLFTRPVKIGRRASGWPAYEVLALQAASIAGKSTDQIRALVRELEAKRAEVET